MMAYFVQSRNDEASLNKFSSKDSGPDPDNLRGGPSHWYDTSRVKKSSQSEW